MFKNELFILFEYTKLETMTSKIIVSPKQPSLVISTTLREQYPNESQTIFISLLEIFPTISPPETNQLYVELESPLTEYKSVSNSKTFKSP